MTPFLLAMSLLFIIIAINVSVFIIGYWLSFLIHHSEPADFDQPRYIRTLKSEERAWQAHASHAPVVFLDG